MTTKLDINDFQLLVYVNSQQLWLIQVLVYFWKGTHCPLDSSCLYYLPQIVMHSQRVYQGKRGKSWTFRWTWQKLSQVPSTYLSKTCKQIKSRIKHLNITFFSFWCTLIRTTEIQHRIVTDWTVESWVRGPIVGLQCYQVILSSWTKHFCMVQVRTMKLSYKVYSYMTMLQNLPKEKKKKKDTK